MKKLILLVALVTIVLIGCDNNGAPLGYTYLELDSCEYIGGVNQLAHKGNCRFCAERKKQEMKKLIKELKYELQK